MHFPHSVSDTKRGKRVDIAIKGVHSSTPRFLQLAQDTTEVHFLSCNSSPRIRLRWYSAEYPLRLRGTEGLCPRPHKGRLVHRNYQRRLRSVHRRSFIVLILRDLAHEDGRRVITADCGQKLCSLRYVPASAAALGKVIWLTSTAKSTRMSDGIS